MLDTVRKTNSAVITKGLLAFLLSLLAMTFAPQLSSAGGKITPRAELKKLQNGLRLILVENRELPYLQMSLVADAGSRHVAPGKAGLAEMTTRTILQGAGELFGGAFQRHVDSLGAQLYGATGREGSSISLAISRREMVAGIELIKELIRNPALNEADFAGALNRQQSHVLQSYDVGFSVLDDLALAELFPGQSYGAAPMGSPATLGNLTLEDVREFQRARYSPENLTLIVAGDIDARDLGPEIARQFASISRSGEAAPEAPEFTPKPSRDLRIVLMDAPGDLSAAVGFYALASKPTDTLQFAGGRMLAHLLGGYPDLSLFGRRLIEDRNLINRLSSNLSFMRGPALMRVEMRCAREHVVDVVAEGLDILRSVSESRISKRELEEGKQYFRGYYALAFECATDVSGMFTQLASVDLDYRYHDRLLERVNELTQGDIREVAKAAFNPDNLVVVVYGDARSFAGDLEDFGRVIHHTGLTSQP